MPERLPGPRYRLKSPTAGETATPENDAIEWIADRKPLFRFGPNQRPNIAQIAYAARISRSNLLKIRRGELPLSAEAMAGLVKASGVDVRDETARESAQRHLFEYVDENQAAELAGAAA